MMICRTTSRGRTSLTAAYPSTRTQYEPLNLSSVRINYCNTDTWRSLAK